MTGDSGNTRITRDFFRRAGRKGGKIGAARRMETTTPEQRKEWARLGGLAKAAKRRDQAAPADQHHAQTP